MTSPSIETISPRGNSLMLLSIHERRACTQWTECPRVYRAQRCTDGMDDVDIVASNEQEPRTAPPFAVCGCDTAGSSPGAPIRDGLLDGQPGTYDHRS